MIIDMRVRPPYGGMVDTHMYRNRERTAGKARSHGYEPPKALQDASWEVFLEEFDSSGIDLGIVPGRCAGPPYGAVPNDDLAELVRSARGRLAGFCSVDVDSPGAVAELERATCDLGLIGLAMDPGFAARPHLPDDAVLLPLLRRCTQLGLPVMITQSGAAGPDVSYCSARGVDRLAAAFPELRIIVAHAGWPSVLDFIGIAYRRPNVWLSPDEYMVNMPGAQHWVEAAQGFLRSRLLFGSSYPFMPFDGALDHYRARFPLADMQRDVLGQNAAALVAPTRKPGT